MTPVTEPRTRLQSFLSRYRAVQARVRELRLSRLQDFLHRYRVVQYRAAQSMAREAEEELDRLTARRFSVFHYWGPNELALSGIIADFLDPRGKHGQGPFFLEKFLNLLNQHEAINLTPSLWDLAATVVDTEVVTSENENKRRRIDILLVNPKSKWAMVIENKPWAAEQPDQVSAYQAQLEKKYRDWKTRVMIYLSGDGSPPKTQNTEMQPPLVMGYQRGKTDAPGFFLSDWLEASRDCCQVDKVRHFLADLADWVAATFKTT